MRSNLKKFLVLTLAAGLSAAVAPAQTNVTPAAKPVDKLTELFGDAVVAKGKGFEIKRSQLDSAMIGIRASAAARGQQLGPEQMELLERQVLDRLIQIGILLNLATDADRTKGKETSEKRFEVILKRAGSEEALTRQLKSVGMEMAEMRTRMIEEATAEAVLERELKVSITDADAKKFYDENPAQFEEPEKVRASHILVGTTDPATRQPLSAEQKAAKRKLADDLLKRAKAGEDFAKLAKEYSDDGGSKERGGEYTFPRGQMVPEFESAAFSLSTNQISDIVTTQFGFHIIKLSEKIPAQKVELAKVQDDLKELLRQQEIQKQLPDYVEKIKQGADVEILDAKLKAKSLPAAPSPTAKPDDKKK